MYVCKVCMQCRYVNYVIDACSVCKVHIYYSLDVMVWKLKLLPFNLQNPAVQHLPIFSPLFLRMQWQVVFLSSLNLQFSKHRAFANPILISQLLHFDGKINAPSCIQRVMSSPAIDMLTVRSDGPWFAPCSFLSTYQRKILSFAIAMQELLKKVRVLRLSSVPFSKHYQFGFWLVGSP